MLNRRRVQGLIAGVLLGFSAGIVEATPITGDFSITGNFLPVVGATGAKTTLGLATGLDFINFFGSLATPGVAGTVAVNSGTGDFQNLVGTLGTMRDFSFAGNGSIKYPTTTLLSFQSFPTFGLTFDLASVGVVLQTASFLVLSGTGTFHLAGFDDTAGTFDFSGNGARSTFSFSASQAAAIPEPSSLFLGLVGIGGAWGLRRRIYA
jgi:PEP-CTERM motif